MNQKSITTGAIGGLAGGAVFGAMMGMQGMLPMVAMLVGSESAMVGLLIHMLNSAIIGGLFAVTLGARATNLVSGTKMGLAYGITWWFLGPLLIMPIALGMGPQLSLSGMQGATQSLVGHIVFGGILGATFPLIAKRQSLASEKVVEEEDNNANQDQE